MAYRSDGLKKTLTWSSPEARDYFGAILKDHATAASCSESSLIETALYAHYLPQHKNAKYIAEGLYTLGLAHCYESVCHIYEAGANWNAAYANGRAMIEALRDAMIANGTSVNVSGCLHDLAYCHKNLRAIADYLNEYDPVTADYLRDLINIQVDEPERCNFYNLLVVLLQTWEWVGSKSLTYRSIAAMCRMAPQMIDDNEVTRTRFLATLKSISEIWT